MIHNLNSAMFRHADLLRKQRENLAEMFQLALADLDAAIADADAMIGGPRPPEVATGEPPVQLRNAAE